MYANHTKAYDNDVIIGSATIYSGQKLEMDVTNNGWVFVAYNIFDSLTNYGGFIVKRSKDDGRTWQLFTEANFINTEYTDIDITVAGNDSTDMQLFVAGIARNKSNNTFGLFVDMYDAVSGQLMDGGVVSHSTGTRKIYDLALANSYKSPGSGEVPYSVGLAYSCFGSTSDSVNYYVSMDGGYSFLPSKNVATTSYYFSDVSIAYGRSAIESSGRYYLAWHRRMSLGHNRGNIFTAHNTSFVNSGFSEPFAVDSVDPVTANKSSNPCIAVSVGDYNDSIGVTAVVLMDVAYNGNDDDMDVVSFHNRLAYSSEHWYVKAVANGATESTLYGDISFDPGNNNFLATYLNKTDGKVNYVANNLNMALAWTPIATQINNSTAGMSLAHPKVVINPAKVQTAHAWVQITASGFSFMFDAEYNITTGIADAETMGINVYPNPANNFLNIQLSETGDAAIAIYDLSGREVMTKDIVEHAVLDISQLTQGMYVLRIVQSGNTGTTRFVKK